MRRPALAKRFQSSTRGSAVVEFAVVFPVLLILLMLGTQLVTYVNAVRKVELLATSISEMISQAPPPQGSTTATVNYQDLHFAYDSGLVIFPYLMPDSIRQGVYWWQDLDIFYASVQFTKVANTTCPTTGDQSPCFTANVVWSGGYSSLQNLPAGVPNQVRACSPSPGSTTSAQLPMNNTSAPSSLYLPRSIFGAGSIIVVDIVFKYRPTFAGSLWPTPLTISRSVYVQPRYASLINYDKTNSDGIASKCSGY